jgi:hypothetical protein
MLPIKFVEIFKHGTNRNTATQPFSKEEMRLESFTSKPSHNGLRVNMSPEAKLET